MFFKAGLSSLIVLLGFMFHNITKELPPPKLEETWWGPGEGGKDDITIKPFKIDVPDKILQDLKERLERTRPFTSSLQNSKQSYGINSQLLVEFVEFWKTKYNWRERENFLNRYPQFTTQVQGLYIHYLHVKPQNDKNHKVLPLLLLHGWPGSVREFYEIIPMLTTPRPERNFVFELIIPSLPGYGFSDGTIKSGLGAYEVGVVFNNLMRRLGFEKYYIQGGDWGSLISASMGSLFAERVLGVHSNTCMITCPLLIPRFVVHEKQPSRTYPVSNVFYMAVLEFGYSHLQATKPDTLGVGLNDSPVGLAAYILEKFITWTNPEWKNITDGGLKSKYKYEDLLDNVMIYWITNSITTSVRLYAETMNIEKTKLEMESVPIKVPTACIKFRYELMYFTDSLLKERYVNMVQSTHVAEGGHFAAFELPKLLADDLWSAIDKMEIVNKK